MKKTLDRRKESKKLLTWAEQSTFRYESSVVTGTLIMYGTGRSSKVTASEYDRMLKHFKGKTVYCGTSRDSPQRGSLGEWLQENIEKRTIASYVGAILMHEEYAKRLGSQIQFL